MVKRRPGYELPMLFAAAFRSIIDELHEDLAREGHPHARPLHGFALQAIGVDGATISELGRRLGVSKQAAGKTAMGLERIGYIRRLGADDDARVTRLERTDRGEDMLRASAAILARIQRRWERRLGGERLANLEDGLAELVAGDTRATLMDFPGWLRYG